MEDKLGGRQPSVEDGLQCKTAFGGRRPLVEEKLWWKKNFGGRIPSMDPCMLPTPLCGIFLDTLEAPLNHH